MPCTDLTPTLQAKCAKSWERYARIYSEVEAEFIAEFGAIRFPMDRAIHREAQRRVELEQRHEAEDRPEYVASGLY